MLHRDPGYDAIYGATDRHTIPATQEVKPGCFPVTFDRILRPVETLRAQVLREFLKVFFGGRSLQHFLVDLRRNAERMTPVQHFREKFYRLRNPLL